MFKHLTLLFLVIVLASSAQKQFQLSPSVWQFRQVGTETFYPVQVPGTVHQDLIHHHLIPDPYHHTNEQLVHWVENESWEYKNTFLCERELASYKHTELVFEGLDTYAKVFVNGEEVLQSTNMFLKYKVDVKKFLKKEGDMLEIRVVFEQAAKHGKAEAKQLPYTLPGDEKVFTRKAQYQYGWDWGPRLVTCGIYKPVYLNCWNDVNSISLRHQIKTLTDTLAELYIISETECDKPLKQAAWFDCRSFDSPDHYENMTSFGYATDTFDLKTGINIDTLLVKIKNPERWYCNGQGKQTMYIGTLWLGSAYAPPIQQIEFGLRTIELVKEKDAVGETFYFKLNGSPVFMKGANFIPPDNFVAGTEHLDDLIQKAKAANINMLRVWGGGLYLDDRFYCLCDKNGILVWQDFMFACAMYPGDEPFLQSVKEEAGQQVRRLRNHACLALWCGNNEVDEGWHNWGWQKQYHYSKTDSAKIWNDYQTLFHGILPEAVKRFDSKTPYVSSSPMLGWGKKESLLQGDSHYWGVWWGMESFDVYEKKVGRFMSEYGFQGMPSYFTWKKYGDSLDLNSSYIKAHQKHPTGYQTINTYMQRDYKVPTNFFHYVYASQLLQRDGMQIAIEAHRRNKPYCMGSLYWQWNDCWPVTSWSAIDYDHQPKALYYATKKLYANFCLSVDTTGKRCNVYVISDSTKSIHARLEVRLRNTKGETLLTKVKEISVKENSSDVFENFSDEELKPFNKKDIYLSCKLTMNGKIMAHKNYFFVKPKELLLYRPSIRIGQKDSSISITSDVFVKDLYLYTKEGDLAIPDNYMDLEPGEPAEIRTSSGIKLSEQIQYLSLYDINP